MSRILRIGEIYHQNDYDETDDLGIAVAADELIIPVTHAHVAKTTGDDAEACTLANGVPGQLLNIILSVDGNGDATITPVTASGWATIVLADVGDSVVLFYVDDVGGWRIWALNGTGGPPAFTV